MTMNANAMTRLRLDATGTVLSLDASTEVVLTVSVCDIADRLFHHQPPTPFEMEQAIDAVEDALTRSRLPHAQRDDLATDDPRLREWVTIGHPQFDESRLTGEEVEALFQRLASASLGHPTALAGLPTGRDAAAALLILRECMHHLGFGGVRFGMP